MIVPKAEASKVIHGAHSYIDQAVEKTLELRHRRYQFHRYTPTRLRDLLESVVQRCDTCQTWKL